MLFSSYEFLLGFLPITVIVYFLLLRARLIVAAKAWLIIASLFFYSWWNPIYLPLLLISIAFNFTLGSTLAKTSTIAPKKALLIFGITANVALLGYFKYADFFIETTNDIAGTNFNLVHVILPLGLSFITFQKIAYLVDSYKGKTHEYNLLNFSLFVTFFPQLIAGPIVHHAEVMPQFDRLKNKFFNSRNFALGMMTFTIGLFKKVIIADTFAIWANKGFDEAPVLSFLEAWATSLSYTLQLYFDFSGYTDMALGAALLFNIHLPPNFNSPYKARNIQDFWRRWHMTLSRFLRDYVYIPLGGNRYGDFITYRNLVLTFLIGGFWHGAGWTFIFWGFLHGAALVVQHMWGKLRISMHYLLAWLITFNFVNIAWVFFRAKEWDDAIKVLKGMVGLSGFALPNALAPYLKPLSQYGVEFGAYLAGIQGNEWTLIYIVAALILAVAFNNSNQMRATFKPTASSAVFAAILFVAALMQLHAPSEFLYFDF